MSQTPILRFKNAALGYGRHAVLTGVDFEIEQGSFVGILGHNGSGKTTLLRTILGLIPCVKGQFAHPSGPRAPRFGYVPQKERLDPIYPLTAYQVAAMGTYRRLEVFHGLRGLSHRALIERCLADCGAANLAGKLYSALSGGQKQRVLIARALAAEPDILVLDEPLAGIDITTQKSLLDLLKTLKDKRHLTILMVSHRIQSERNLFSHIVWVDEGKVTVGRTDEMLSGGKLSEIFESEL